MDSESTRQLALTRLWYLIGEWEGTGKGPEGRFRAQAKYSWALNDHFITGYLELVDHSSGQIVSTEHTYVYYDCDLSCLVGDIFSLDGMVEHATGRADARGRLVLTTERPNCVSKDKSIRRLRRTLWTMAAAQWAFTVEVDSGQGFAPYLEGQMRRR